MNVGEAGVDERARRERAHAAGIRPAVVIEDALVILGRRRAAIARVAVTEREERHLGSGQALLDHEPRRRRRRTGRRPCAARTAASASRAISATTTPLPAARPSALTTTGNPNVCPDTAASAVVERVADDEPRRRDAVRAMKCLEWTFEHSRAAPRPRGRQSAGPSSRNRSRQSPLEGGLGPDDGQVDPLAVGQGEHVGRDRARSTGRHVASCGNPRIPGAARTS